MSAPIIGQRLRALRHERKLSQDDLARLLGFKDRQTVSAIETGERRVTADELLLAMEKLGVPLEHFTDPFRLVGEGRFSWRQTEVETEQLREYERAAGRWIAAFRALAPKVGRDAPLLRRALGLTRNSRYEDAERAGEQFVAEFNLGDVPATELAEVMERELGILVLLVDAPEGISGAACRLPELDTVLITRHETEGRRHFDLAHELFHILTWDAMPPEHSEDARDSGGNRVEQLANNFAAAMLMPKAALVDRGNWKSMDQHDLIARLNTVADQLRVTSSALRWRLVTLGQLDRAVARALPADALHNNGRPSARGGAVPNLYSKPFIEVLCLAIDEGLVSMRRVAVLLDMAFEDFADLCTAHGVETSVRL